MVGAAIGLGSILHHTPPDPVRFTTVVVICQRGLLATGGDFWADIPRIAGDYGLLWMPVVLL